MVSTRSPAGVTGQVTLSTLPQDFFDPLNKLKDVSMNEVWVLDGLPVKGGMDRIRQQYNRDRAVYVSLLDPDTPAAPLTDALPHG